VFTQPKKVKGVKQTPAAGKLIIKKAKTPEAVASSITDDAINAIPDADMRASAREMEKVLKPDRPVRQHSLLQRLLACLVDSDPGTGNAHPPPGSIYVPHKLASRSGGAAGAASGAASSGVEKTENAAGTDGASGAGSSGASSAGGSSAAQSQSTPYPGRPPVPSGVTLPDSIRGVIQMAGVASNGARKRPNPASTPGGPGSSTVGGPGAGASAAAMKAAAKKLPARPVTALEERVKEELKHAEITHSPNLIGDLNDREREDDAVCVQLRDLQVQLRDVMQANNAVRTRVYPLAEAYAARRDRYKKLTDQQSHLEREFRTLKRKGLKKMAPQHLERLLRTYDEVHAETGSRADIACVVVDHRTFSGVPRERFVDLPPTPPNLYDFSKLVPPGGALGLNGADGPSPMTGLLTPGRLGAHVPGTVPSPLPLRATSTGVNSLSLPVSPAARALAIALNGGPQRGISVDLSPRSAAAAAVKPEYTDMYAPALTHAQYAQQYNRAPSPMRMSGSGVIAPPTAAPPLPVSPVPVGSVLQRVSSGPLPGMGSLPLQPMQVPQASTLNIAQQVGPQYARSISSSGQYLQQPGSAGFSPTNSRGPSGPQSEAELTRQQHVAPK